MRTRPEAATAICIETKKQSYTDRQGTKVRVRFTTAEKLNLDILYYSTRQGVGIRTRVRTAVGPLFEMLPIYMVWLGFAKTHTYLSVRYRDSRMLGQSARFIWRTCKYFLTVETGCMDPGCDNTPETRWYYV